jgi:hypothetical protein
VSDFDILLSRLTKAGVGFRIPPSRLHHQNHGNLRDTFFVSEGRRRYDTCVGWDMDFPEMKPRFRRGEEAIIDKWTSTPMRKFVRGPLYLKYDIEALVVCEGEPPADTPSRHVIVLAPYVASPPISKAPSHEQDGLQRG